MPTPELRVTPSSLHVCFGDFEVDELNALLICDGSSIALPPIPFGLLCALLRNPGTLLSKHSLLDRVWGHRFVSDSVLKGAISDIRRLLGDDPRAPRYIETVPRRGYRFIAPTVAVIEKPDAVTSSTDVLQQVTPTTSEPEVEALSTPLFVGRLAPLTRLQQAWDRAIQGKRGIVWVAGEPGIGKSTLIEHFVAGLKGVSCVFGQCVQHHGAGEPYLPVLEALSELCRRDPQAATLLREIAPAWLLQLPWLSTVQQREALLHELVGANPQRMLREMGEFIDRYTELHPLLLVTEDLQWADQSTIQLIDYMARRRSCRRLMWLSSFRLTEIIALEHPLNTIRHELRPLALSDEILLDSFSESEVAEYLHTRSPMMATHERLVRTLHQRSGGVPLFVASIANEVIDSAAAAGTEDAVLLAATRIPQSLSSLIDHYVSRLSDQQRKLMTLAAVAGMELHSDTLAHALGWDAQQISEVCDELVRERVWLVVAKATEQATGDQHAYEFRHALYRQRLYDVTTPSTRSELHLKIAVALEQQRAKGLHTKATELAIHFDLARSPLQALGYYAEAAQSALLHLSPSECMSLTAKALQLAAQMPDSEQRLSLEITLNTLRGVAAFHTLGAGDTAKEAYLRAVELVSNMPQHPMTGLALYGLGFLHYLHAEYSEALATAELAQALALRSDNSLLVFTAGSIKGQVLLILGQYMPALQALEQALPTLQQASASAEHNVTGYIVDPQVTVLTMLSLVLSQLGRFNEATQRMQQAYTRSRHITQPTAMMITIWCDALCGIRRGDTARVGALAKEMQLLVDEYSLVQGKAACRWFLGWSEARCGQPEQGFRRIREAYDKNRALGMIAGGSETLGYAAEALIIQGDWQQAQQQLDQAFDIVQRHGERIYLPQLLLIQSAIAHLRGDATAEAEALRQAITETHEQGAAWLELLVLTAYCEHATPTSDDLLALERLVNTLSESGDDSLLQQARSIIHFAQDS